MSDTIPRAEVEELYSRAIVLIAAFLREDFEGIAALEGEDAGKLLPHFGAFPCFPGSTGSPQLPFPALPAARGQGMSIGALIKGDGVRSEVSLKMRPGESDALVLEVGADAVATWELLTEPRRVDESSALVT
jgi:hypothetical protein